MKTLKTVRLKPNPAGKDRTRYGTSATLLGAEWVDIQNYGRAAVDMTGVRLCHVAYSPGDRNGRWAEVMSFKGTLPAGETVRVHSGSGPLHVLNPEDRQGTEHHLFTGGNYVWNNAEGDCSGLFEAGQTSPFDRPCYDPHPPEGVVLQRVGDKLVAQVGAVAGYRR
jgi:hypothetical protein